MKLEITEIESRLKKVNYAYQQGLFKVIGLIDQKGQSKVLVLDVNGFMIARIANLFKNRTPELYDNFGFR